MNTATKQKIAAAAPDLAALDDSGLKIMQGYLDKPAQILAYLRGCQESKALSEISEDLDFNPNTARNILYALHDGGAIKLDGDRKWSIK